MATTQFMPISRISAGCLPKALGNSLLFRAGISDSGQRAYPSSKRNRRTQVRCFNYPDLMNLTQGKRQTAYNDKEYEFKLAMKAIHGTREQVRIFMIKSHSPESRQKILEGPVVGFSIAGSR
jgi:hypothetical protein